MLASPSILVNPWAWRLGLFLCLLGLPGCGFQLNRNQVSLPGGAKTLALQVENRTYTSGLGIKLHGELSRLLSGANVNLVPVPLADLVLEIQLTGASYERLDLSLYNTQNYQFHFVDQASLTLQDPKKHKPIFESVPLSGTFNFETPATELGTEDLRDSRDKALRDLAKKIVARLGQNF